MVPQFGNFSQACSRTSLARTKPRLRRVAYARELLANSALRAPLLITVWRRTRAPRTISASAGKLLTKPQAPLAVLSRIPATPQALPRLPEKGKFRKPGGGKESALKLRIYRYVGSQIQVPFGITAFFGITTTPSRI